MLKDTPEGAGSENTSLENTMFENTMFADSMLETSWGQRTRRSWMTMTSFGLQALIIGLLLLLPVLKTVGLPAARTVSTPISLGRRSADPQQGGLRNTTPHTAQPTFAARLVAPGHVPPIISMAADDPSSGPPSGSDIGIGVGFPPGIEGGPSISNIIGTRAVMPSPPPTIVRAIRTSSMLEGNLIRRIEPVYPPLARSARIQGSVVLVAVISKAGTIDNLHALSGHPMLVPAALAAVSQWRYRPYILNSEPIEVETQITVNFYLAGN
jgi:periplasmic protein TonB